LLDVTARLAVTDPPAPPAAVTDPKSNDLIDLSSLVMDKEPSEIRDALRSLLLTGKTVPYETKQVADQSNQHTDD
jgi:hypothetical protein